MGGSKAVVLIGGPSKGTRFRPLSFVAPKPLFPLAGGALLDQHVAACAEAGVEEVLLIGFFAPEQFSAYCAAARAAHGVRVRYLAERGRLGTGGGLHAFAAELAAGLGADGVLFVLHCDILCAFPLAQLRAFHRAAGGMATLLATRAPAAGPFGRLVLAPAGEVLHYAEKPETFVSDVANCGVYAFSPALFQELARVAAAKARRAAGHARSPSQPPLYPDLRSSVAADGSVRIGLEQDLLMPLAGTGRLFGFVTDDYWLQLKRPIAALQASRLLLARGSTCGQALAGAEAPCRVEGDVLIDPSARVHPTAKLGPNVTVGRDVVVGAGVRVRNSILLPGVELEERACVLNSIVGWRSRVGPWARVEGSDPAEHITILGEGVVAQPEICVRDCIVLPHKELSRNHAGEIIL